jgi:COP9 signalosome complex subunit 4
LTDVCNQLQKLPEEVSKSVSHFTLDKVMYYYVLFLNCCLTFLNCTPSQVQPRVISFEEQVASIRQHLADIYEKKQCWRDAANVLVGIPLETGQKYENPYSCH